MNWGKIKQKCNKFFKSAKKVKISNIIAIIGIIVVIVIAIKYSDQTIAIDRNNRYGYYFDCSQVIKAETNCELNSIGKSPINNEKDKEQFKIEIINKTNYIESFVIQSFGINSSKKVLLDSIGKMYYKPPLIKAEEVGGEPFRFSLKTVFKRGDKINFDQSDGNNKVRLELVCEDGAGYINGNNLDLDVPFNNPNIVLINSDEHKQGKRARVFTNLKEWLWDNWSSENINMVKGANNNGLTSLSIIYFRREYKLSAIAIKQKLDILLQEDNKKYYSEVVLKDINEYSSDWDARIIYNESPTNIVTCGDIDWGLKNEVVLQVPKNLSECANIIIVVKRA